MGRTTRISARVPRKSAVLLYGDVRSSELSSDLSKSDIQFEVMDISKREVNVWVALLALPRMLRKGARAFEAYVLTYIRLVAPRIVLTFIDNDPRFWALEEQGRVWKKVVVQNGLRASDFFSALEPAGSIDALFAFGNRDLQLFSEKTRVVKGFVFGSYLSNRVPISRRKPESCATWISQFEIGQEKPRSQVKQLASSELSPQRDQFLQFVNLARLLNMKVQVLGRCIKQIEIDEERHWFLGLAPKEFEVSYISQEDADPYRVCDDSQLLGTRDSTLGLEALSRGSTVFFFSPSNSVSYLALLDGSSNCRVFSAEDDVTARHTIEELKTFSFSSKVVLGSEIDFFMARDEGNRSLIKALRFI